MGWSLVILNFKYINAMPLRLTQSAEWCLESRLMNGE